MLASFSEFERATIAERSRDGLRRAFKEGRHIGRIPYGYDVDKDGALVVVEDEACVVRQIIANVAGGSTLYSEAKRLNDEGEPSPGFKYRNRSRKSGPAWRHTTVRSIITQGAYSGVHTVKASGGDIERQVPPIVEPGLREKALARLKENKRYAGGKAGRKYLLRGLMWCTHCVTAYVADPSTSSTGSRYYYYGCWKHRKTAYERWVRKHSCPRVNAKWIEELVWRDLRSFLEKPGEVLERIKEQLAEGHEGDDFEKRYTSLTRRLAAKQEEKSRYVKLYAQGHVDEEELEVFMADLKNQVENLKLLIASVEADLDQKQENKMVAESTEAWLMALRKNLAEVEKTPRKPSTTAVSLLNFSWRRLP